MTEVVTGRRALDPDALAALEEERDFLLRSLTDLDQEHAAGDVNDHDYHALKDDYTARASAVLRSIDERRIAFTAAAKPPRWGRRVAWLGGIVLLAILSGWLIQRSSGSRGTGDSATGDPLRDTRQLLSDAQQAAVSRDYPKSIALYTKVLDIQPGNVEALTYRAWSKVRSGDPADAATDLDAAIDLDPKYPDARVFRASVYATAEQWDPAAEQLRVFDTLDSPPLMAQIISSQRLRERIALGRIEPKLLVANPPTFSAAGFTADEVFLAAQQLDVDGRADDEVKLYEQLLKASPNDIRALSYQAWVFARLGVSQKLNDLVTRASTMLDKAVALDANYPDARVFRAFTLQFGLNRSADAKADLAAFDAMATKPAALVTLIDSNGLRAAIDASLAGK